MSNAKIYIFPKKSNIGNVIKADQYKVFDIDENLVKLNELKNELLMLAEDLKEALNQIQN